MKKLLEDQNVIYISLLWSANKVQKFFFQNKTKQKQTKKMRKASNSNQICSAFWKVILLNIYIDYF